MTPTMRSSLAYLCLLSFPLLATTAVNMQEKTLYASFLVLFNCVAMALFFLQFPLVGRLKGVGVFANINWSMFLHRRVGKWLAVIFLLHPVLILAPRFLVSFDTGMESLVAAVQARQLLTGIIGWRCCCGCCWLCCGIACQCPMKCGGSRTCWVSSA